MIKQVFAATSVGGVGGAPAKRSQKQPPQQSPKKHNHPTKRTHTQTPQTQSPGRRGLGGSPTRPPRQAPRESLVSLVAPGARRRRPANANTPHAQLTPPPRIAFAPPPPPRTNKQNRRQAAPLQAGHRRAARDPQVPKVDRPPHPQAAVCAPGAFLSAAFFFSAARAFLFCRGGSGTEPKNQQQSRHLTNTPPCKTHPTPQQQQQRPQPQPKTTGPRDRQPGGARAVPLDC